MVSFEFNMIVFKCSGRNGSSTTSETDLDDSDDVNQPQNNWDTSWSPHSSPPPPPLPDSPQSYAQSSQAFHSRSRHGSSSLRSQPQLSSSPQAQKIPEPAPKCRSKISHPKINGNSSTKPSILIYQYSYSQLF